MRTLDTRYDPQSPPAQYDDLGATARLQLHRDAMQRLNSQPNTQNRIPERTKQLSRIETRSGAARAAMAAEKQHHPSDGGEPVPANQLLYGSQLRPTPGEGCGGDTGSGEPQQSLGLVHAGALVEAGKHTDLSATCALCLSSTSMLSRQGSVFCAWCNRDALVPRVEGQLLGPQT